MSRTSRPVPGITLRREPRGPWFTVKSDRRGTTELSINVLKERTHLYRVSGRRKPPRETLVPAEINGLIAERKRIIGLAEAGIYSRDAKPGEPGHARSSLLRAVFRPHEQEVLHLHSKWVREILIPWRERREVLLAAVGKGFLDNDQYRKSLDRLSWGERQSLERYLARRNNRAE